jgi:hypothetical protein
MPDEAAQAAAQAAANVIPFGAPTQEPGIPVTDGAEAGAGVGMNALGLPVEQEEDVSRFIPYLPVLEYMANQEGASWAMRNIVRRLKAMV